MDFYIDFIEKKKGVILKLKYKKKIVTGIEPVTSVLGGPRSSS